MDGTTLVSRLLLCVSISLLFVVPAPGGGRNDPWQAIRQLNRGVGYVFVKRDMTCQYGQLKKVTGSSVSIKTDRADVVIDRSALLRVRWGFGGRSVKDDNPNLPLFILFSGRSSWGDLLAFQPFESKEHPGSTLHFSLTTKDGKSHRGILREVEPEAIVLADSFGTTSTFGKGQIGQVDFITQKPLSDTEEFHWEELAMLRVFDPQLYPRMFHIGDTLAVTLYQSRRTEDDSKIACS